MYKCVCTCEQVEACMCVRVCAGVCVGGFVTTCVLGYTSSVRVSSHTHNMIHSPPGRSGGGSHVT